jgi:hypothetical protein
MVVSILDGKHQTFWVLNSGAKMACCAKFSTFGAGAAGASLFCHEKQTFALWKDKYQT